MPDPASRRSALIAAAMLVGPAIPSTVVVNRPAEAATALTRMADLLIPWLEAAEPASPSTTSAEAAATAAKRTPETGGKNDGSNERPGTETQ